MKARQLNRFHKSIFYKRNHQGKNSPGETQHCVPGTEIKSIVSSGLPGIGTMLKQFVSRVFVEFTSLRLTTIPKPQHIKNQVHPPGMDADLNDWMKPAVTAMEISHQDPETLGKRLIIVAWPECRPEFPTDNDGGGGFPRTLDIWRGPVPTCPGNKYRVRGMPHFDITLPGYLSRTESIRFVRFEHQSKQFLIPRFGLNDKI